MVTDKRLSENIATPFVLRRRWCAGEDTSGSVVSDRALSPSCTSGRSARWDAKLRFRRRPSACTHALFKDY